MQETQGKHKSNEPSKRKSLVNRGWGNQQQQTRGSNVTEGNQVGECRCGVWWGKVKPAWLSGELRTGDTNWGPLLETEKHYRMEQLRATINKVQI